MEIRVMSYMVAWLPADLWGRCKSGDRSAIIEAATMLDGIVIYDHAFSGAGEMVAVEIGELEEVGVIRSVTLHREVI